MAVELRDEGRMTGKQTTSGLDNELAQPFLAYFEEQGCRIDLDPVYRERYNIDFGVSRIRDVHAAVSLGIHLTRETDNFGRQEILLEAARKGVVARSIYVEICSPVLDTGVIPVTFSACVAFLFDRRYQHTKTIGLRVFEDCSYHFFDLEENVRRLRKDIHDSEHDAQELMHGNIIAYFSDKGFGFIEEEHNQKFFFHIANVIDEKLRLALPGYVQGDTIPVRFSYGGSEGKKYPKAIDVRCYDD